MCTADIFAIKLKALSPNCFFSHLFFCPDFLPLEHLKHWSMSPKKLFSQRKFSIVFFNLTLIVIFCIFFRMKKHLCSIISKKQLWPESHVFTRHRVKCELVLGVEGGKYHRNQQLSHCNALIISFPHCRIPNLVQISVFYHSQPLSTLWNCYKHPDR